VPGTEPRGINPEFVPGTVSFGTMKPQDLIPSFLDELERLAPEEFNAFIQDPAYAASQEADEDSEWWESEQANSMLNELFDVLNAQAPEGYFFGAPPSDGADYGFWPVSE